MQQSKQQIDHRWLDNCLLITRWRTPGNVEIQWLGVHHRVSDEAQEYPHSPVEW